MQKLKWLCLAVITTLCLPSLSSAMSADGYIGPGSLSGDGVNRTFRVSRDGSLVIQEGHGKYQEAALRGNVWSCSNAAGTSVTTQAGLSHTTPMLTLYNPTGSNKALVLLEVNVTPTAAPAAAAGLMLAYNVATGTAPVHTTAANYMNASMGIGGTPTAVCDRVATLLAPPVAFRYFGGTTGAAAISGATFTDNIDGKFIMPPGMAISIQTTSAVVGVGHFVWEEINYP